ncbi:hypothetical protein [Helcococcus ovis]|uniref:hypothetical protein n=1 Tax=Helcococcus ovis TaxID=72026 RepID=UPI0014320EA5|nr:hypothetical protein [Helcococcus ovis]WNZ01171.1 hypothetical protein EQF90_007860 [Helcococcus ovis]
MGKKWGLKFVKINSVCPSKVEDGQKAGVKICKNEAKMAPTKEENEKKLGLL